MKKRTYRAVDVKKVDRSRLGEEVKGRAMVFGVDVGKEDCYGWFRDRQDRYRLLIKWKHPRASRQVVGLLKGLDCASMEVAMEPSGSYGDPLRALFWEAGLPVYRVSPKRSHDAAEVFDGVPSSHDPKSAGIVAKLHVDGASELWEVRSEEDRNLRAAVDTLDLFHEQLQRNLGRLEARMARYWPEGDDPSGYLSGSQWVKSLGLNLKERSSGKHVGKLKITKRGSGKARRWLYLAALRLIQTDVVVRAWYQGKVMRDGGVKKKAIVAIMRKLVKALWYVAQGDPFDARKMFDAKRLGLSAV